MPGPLTISVNPPTVTTPGGTEVTVDGGVPPYTLDIAPPPNVTATKQLISQGPPAIWHVAFTGTGSGDATITATDSDGAQASVQVPIN